MYNALKQKMLCQLTHTQKYSYMECAELNPNIKIGWSAWQKQQRKYSRWTYSNTVLRGLVQRARPNPMTTKNRLVQKSKGKERCTSSKSSGSHLAMRSMSECSITSVFATIWSSPQSSSTASLVFLWRILWTKLLSKCACINSNMKYVSLHSSQMMD